MHGPSPQRLVLFIAVAAVASVAWTAYWRLYAPRTRAVRFASALSEVEELLPATVSQRPQDGMSAGSRSREGRTLFLTFSVPSHDIRGVLEQWLGTRARPTESDEAAYGAKMWGMAGSDAPDFAWWDVPMGNEIVFLGTKGRADYELAFAGRAEGGERTRFYIRVHWYLAEHLQTGEDASTLYWNSAVPGTVTDFRGRDRP